MLELITSFNSAINSFVWGPVMLALLVGTGVFLTFKTGFIQGKWFGYIMKHTVGGLFRKGERKDKSGNNLTPFQAVTTALAGTVGTGNIAGVTGAIFVGGAGAVFWMWVSAFFGMCTKYAEIVLAMKYRVTDENGVHKGGPMYYIENGLGKNWKPLAFIFALLGGLASFGIGNIAQASEIAGSMKGLFGFSNLGTGIILAIVIAFVLVGGVQRIGHVTSLIVPFMALFYIAAGVVVIVMRIGDIPAVLASIFTSAFIFEAICGGIFGYAIMTAMKQGFARGVFSNEAGMGSAANTAAAATTTDPVRQGYINMTGTFWDTIVVCTITGLCIASSGVLGTTETHAQGTYSYSAEAHTLNVTLNDGDKTTVSQYNVSGDTEQFTLSSKYEDNIILTPVSDNTYSDDAGNKYIFSEDGTLKYDTVVTGAALTIMAFETVLGEPGGWLVCIGIALFAFSTILGWEYHGEKAFEYLFNTHKFNMVYRIFFSCIVFLGATTSLQIAWNFSDIANALMAIPNLICLIALSGVIVDEMNRYQKIIKSE